MITAIPAASVHAITSNQVVISLETAVKELVENSLDAGATSIDVKFKQYGVRSVEVVDNGSGIQEQDWESIDCQGLKHHTSKIADWSDLDNVTSFGFRGEALSALCAMCDQVTVTTKANETVGATLELDKTGKVKGKKRVARQRGTTILLSNLFSPLPVRRKDFERNAKREYGKTLSLLQAYALVPCSKLNGVRLTVTNVTDKGSKSTSIQTQGKPSVRASVTALWGPKSLEGVQDLSLNFSTPRPKLKRVPRRSMREEAQLGEDTEQKDTLVDIKMTGLISSPGHGRGGNDRQFLFVNGRPCELDKVQKCINEVFRSFTANHDVSKAPLVVADIELPTDYYDVNVTPDKRTIFLHNEPVFLDALKDSLEEFLQPSRSTFDVQGTQRSGTQTNLDTQRKSQVSHPEPEVEVDEDEEERPSRRKSTGRQMRTNPSDDEDELEETDNRKNEALVPPPKKRMRVSSPRSSSPPAHLASGSSEVGGSVLSTSSRGQLSIPSSSSVSSSVHRTSPAEENDCMEVDIPGSSRPRSSSIVHVLPPASSKKGKSKGKEDVVVNTLFTAWGKEAAKRKEPREEDEDDAEVVTQKASVKQAKSDIGAKLAGFARKGSQPTLVADEDSEHEEEAEEMVPSKPTEPDGDASMDVDPPKSPPLSRRQSKKVVLTIPEDEPPDHSQPSTPAKAKAKGKQALQDFSSKLAGFARKGSIVKPVELDEDEDETKSGPATTDDDEHEVETQPKLARLRRRTSSIVDDDQEQGKGMDVDEAPVDPVSEPSFVDSATDAESHVQRPEVIRTTTGGEVTMRFDIDSVCVRWAECRHTPAQDTTGNKNADESGAEGLGDASSSLSRVVSKDDFSEMDIAGQFNLGFIIARRRRGTALDDLFIVDQHAADEKYNFELLQTTTTIRSQKLLRPRPLELSASDEMVAREHLDDLRQNGFEFRVVEDDDEIEELGGSRIHLMAQPVSKSTNFTIKDLEELIHLMRDRRPGQMVRCSKATAMFAMRACRKSIMVGMPLKMSQMVSVVRHMGKMDQPWNCPHGRPTMRHLCDLTSVPRGRQRPISWDS
ncbi:hypothetical protein CYLTODRAFT_441541, partial [Cylindrobasidium torrendii FP15055 ss-10]